MIREVINTHPTENVQYRFTAIMSVETSIFHSDETSSAPIDWAEDRNFEFKDIGPIENALRNAITGENKEGVECKTAKLSIFWRHFISQIFRECVGPGKVTRKGANFLGAMESNSFRASERKYDSTMV